MTGGLSMIEITYNVELCKKCGLCATACPLAELAPELEGLVDLYNRAQSCAG